MSVSRTTVFWASIFAIAMLCLVLLRQILLPFGVGIALAYMLVPAVGALERRGISRSLTALTIVLVLVGGFAAVMLVILPELVGELRFFIDEFPRYVAKIQSLVEDSSRPWVHKVMGQELHMEQTVAKIGSTMSAAWLDELLRSVWSGGEALVSILSLLVVSPIVAIYLLVDWPGMVAKLDSWLSPRHREQVWALGSEIENAVAGFARGQIVICLILAIFYASSLRVIGLNHAILIGVVAGVISFVPYLGAGTGFVVGMCVAGAQFWPNWTPMAIVAGIFIVGEGLADYVLSPRIIGSRVDLSPVWLMFALFAFGSLFGFVGLLIAVPLAASFGVVLRFAMRQSLDSEAVSSIPPAGNYPRL